MLHAVKISLNIKHKLFHCAFLCAAILVLLSASDQAQCTSWDASGEWRIVQRGQLVQIRFRLEQKGRVLTGRARSVYGPNLDRVVEGTIDGTIEGDTFSVQIFWDGGLTGVYNAKVLPSGRLDGDTYDKNNSRNRQPWHSDGVLPCLPTPVVVQAAAPHPIRSSGKARTPSKPASPAPKPPYITPGQAIIPTPMNPFGIVSLGWDGGPDHPNVEVLVSIDDGDEIPAFSIEHSPQSPVWKQKIASIPLQLQRHHHYKFVLKDAAGETLSTAAFVIP